MRNTSNMENYEQKYKEALEWVRSIYPTMQGTDKEDAEHFFPELKESDERIKGRLLEYFKGFSSEYEVTWEGLSVQKIISWLEKQGVREPAWSEEDEDIKETIIGELELVKKSVGEINYKGYDELINWLKSIKSNHWKPSEKQMEALWNVISHAVNSEEDVDTITELSALYEELKNI